MKQLIIFFGLCTLLGNMLLAQSQPTPAALQTQYEKALQASEDYVLDRNRFPGPIEVQMGTLDIPQGEVGCIDVTVANFNDILQMEFTISWNATFFEFIEVNNFNVPNMDASEFNDSPGFLSVRYQDESGSGASLNDGDVAFSVCFRAMGPVGATSSAAFTTIPVQFFATDTASNGNDIGIQHTNGLLRVTEPLLPLTIVDANITHIDCSNIDQGAIDITYEGGLEPVMFTWSNGDDTEDISDLSPGTYTVTITDANDPADEVMMEYVVMGDTQAPTADAGMTAQINCLNAVVALDGSASDSGAAITYLWTTTNGNILDGATNTDPRVDTPGMYELLVTNTENNCTATASVSVSASFDAPMTDAGIDRSLSCTESAISLDGSASDMGTTIEYLWTTTNGNILADDTTLNPTVNSAGMYILTATDTQNGCTDTDTVLVSDPVLPEAIVPEMVDLDCSGGVDLDGSASSMGNEMTYLWTTNDGVLTDGATTTIATAGAAGTYALLVTNTDNGCTATATTTVVFDPVFPIVQVAESEVITCENTSVLLDGTGSEMGEAFSYFWTTTDGNILDGNTTLMPEVDAAGTYQLTVTNDTTACTVTAEVVVMENTTPPTADAGADMELNCDDSSVTLDASASTSGNNMTYLWTTNDGIIDEGATTTSPQVSVAGTYLLTVTNTENGCTATDEVSVSPNSNAPTADAGANTMITCNGMITQLDGTASTSGNNITYLWTSTDGNILDGADTAMPEVDALGTYVLTVTNTDNACTDAATVQVVLDANVPIPQAGDDQEICATEALLEGSTADGVTGTWGTNISTVSIQDANASTTMVSQLVPGENVLFYSYSTDECSDYATDTLVVYSQGVPNANDDLEILEMQAQQLEINVLENDDFTAVDSFSVEILSLPSNIATEDLGEGVLLFDIHGGFVGNAQASYAVCNTACTDFCDTATVSIVVESTNLFGEPEIFFPNGITPNGDGINDAFVVDELEDNRDQYPNSELVVFNRWGDVVYRAQPYYNDWQGTNQSGNDLPQGTYYFILRLDITESKAIKGDITILK